MLMILLAVLGGVLTTLSMVVSSTLGKKIGLIQSTIIHYIGGLIGGVFILIGLGSKIAPSIAEMSNMPFYIFLGGVIGVMVVYTSNVVIPKIPVVYSTLLMFSGQMLCAIIIDAIVMKDFSILKLIGAIIVVLGILYNSRVDAKENKIENQSLKEVENIN
ncbi:DMT family transporter [Clostridium celatum]|uniref:DMT family transporter n=1 Tax=Clostridium celatum TaxID=36834 RepID=UPI001F245D81|nr:DMT family transporter [Clostridium celatum]MCE9655499.1 DMT family transporter [Clostridium celatum]MDY3361520.1 DMT family transporter [Clostridium celatum]